MADNSLKRLGNPFLAVFVLLAAAGIGFGVLRLFMGGSGAGAVEGNEAEALKVLGSVATLEELWKNGDADGNGKKDWWTADWSGFYRRIAANGKPVRMISGQVAGADHAPLEASASMEPKLPGAPHAGYWFRAVPVEGGYAFAAVPAVPGVSGRRVFLTREDGKIWAKTGSEAPAAWPGQGEGAMNAAGWTQVNR